MDSLHSLETQSQIKPHAGTPTPARKPEEEDIAQPGDRYMSSDIAQMVEDIRRCEESAINGQHDNTITAVIPQVEASGSPVAPMEEAPEASHSHTEEGEGQNHRGVSRALTGLHLGIEAAESGGLLIQTAETGAHGAESITHAAHTAAIASQHGEALSPASDMVQGSSCLGSSVSASLIAGVVGSSLVAAGMTALGVHTISEGVRSKDGEKVLEGTGETFLGAKSAAAALSMAGHGAEGALATAAHLAHAALMPLGLAHGAIDVTLGGKKIAHWIKHHDRSALIEGCLEVGQGIAIAAAAVGGGLPAIAIASAFLGGKMIYHQLTR